MKEVEADLMARLTASRCSGSPAIHRRSCCCGRCRRVDDVRVDLVQFNTPKNVREMRKSKAKREGVSRGLGADEIHRGRSFLPAAMAAVWRR